MWGLSLRGSLDTTQVVLRVLLLARWDTTLVVVANQKEDQRLSCSEEDDVHRRSCNSCGAPGRIAHGTGGVKGFKDLYATCHNMLIPEIEI